MKHFLGFITALFAILLYAQSISYEFTYDDAPVITKNRIVREGIKGFPEIIRTDYWHGTEEWLPTPEYRPVPLLLFATEWQFFKDNPHYYHAINVLLYAIVCWLIFLLLCKIVTKQGILLPFICTILYVAHPIHTEVVDSIKSADELLCFFFALLTILFLLKSIKMEYTGTDATLKTEIEPAPDSIPKVKFSLPFILVSAICYFLCILSKETGIAFLFIIPLLLYVFTETGLKKILLLASVYAFTLLLFLIIRYQVLQGISIGTFNSKYNNSLLAAPDLLTQKATACYILLRYFILLLFPHPLTYDYSIATIPLIPITNPLAVTSILLYFVTGLFAVITLIKFKKNKPVITSFQSSLLTTNYPVPNNQNPVRGTRCLIAFAILFYLITLFPVSNLLILIASTMNERFLFIPSLGYTIILTILLLKIKMKQYLIIILLIILSLYSVKTIARSRDWRDNHILFMHDAVISDKSARAQLNYGIDLFLSEYPAEKNEELKNAINDKAIIEFTKSLEYYSDNPRVNYYLGQAYMNKRDALHAIKYFEIALRYSDKPNNLLINNLATLYINTGQSDKAIPLLDSVIKYTPAFSKPYNNLACAYMNLNQFREAIIYGKKAIELEPAYARAFMNVGMAYCNLNKFDSALYYENDAVALDTNDPLAVFNLGVTYYKTGNIEKGQQLMEKSKQMKNRN